MSAFAVMRDRILSSEEWEKLYAAAADHLKPILLVAYHLGPRLSEILNLTWDRVELARGSIKLRSVDTKTGSTPFSRTVELRVSLSVAAIRVSAAAVDCDSARCSRRYQPGLRLGSGTVAGSLVPA